MSAVYYDGKLKNYYVKRFNIETNTINKKFLFISHEKGSKLEYASFRSGETISFKYFINKKLKPTEIKLDDFIDIKGWKSIGNKINYEKIRSGTFSLLGRDEEIYSEQIEDKVLPDNKDKEEIKQENFDVGESLELDLDSDQLNLFNEKD